MADERIPEDEFDDDDDDDDGDWGWDPSGQAARPVCDLPPRLLELDREISFQYAYKAIYPEEARIPLIGRFEAIKGLGEGGYGIVYLARDPELDRLVALKLCPTLDPEAGERFRREARVLAQFSHPHIVTVFEIGAHGPDFFYVMEYVKGYDGFDFIKHWQDWKDVLLVYESAAAGLVTAHEQGITHGDFKPANLLLGEDGRVCVADFGLAQLIGDGAAQDDPAAASHRRGTLPYMAPELLRGRDRDPLSDQWAFCVALWETLYGWSPFEGDTAQKLLGAIERGPPRVYVSAAPWELQAILRRGLSVDRSQRYPDMYTLARALRDVRRPPEPPRGGRRRRWGFWLAALMSGGAVLLALSLRGGSVPEASVLVQPRGPCVTGDFDAEVQPSVHAVCVLIRAGHFKQADVLWDTERAERRRIQAKQVSENTAPDEATFVENMGRDTLTVGRTLLDQAKARELVEPKKASEAARKALAWATRAAMDLGDAHSDAESVITDARRLAIRLEDH